MKMKKCLASLLSLVLVLSLFPAAAFAVHTDAAMVSNSSLAPSAQYFSLDGDEATQEYAGIILSKTAKDIGDGKYTVTLSATVNGWETIEPQRPEVVFAIDRSSSMNYCTEESPSDHNHKDGYPSEADAVNEHRWYIAVDAVYTMVSNLGNIDCSFVVFGDEADDITLEQLMQDKETSNVKGATNLYAGVETALNKFSNDSDSKKILIIVADGEATVANDDGVYYPSDLANDFKERGGEIYTIGFSFTGDSYSDFTGLASDSDHIFTVENAWELEISMEEIRSNIVAMINDPLGGDVSLVSNVDVTLDDDFAEDATVTGDVIFWTSDDGLNGTVTLEYTVKIDNYGSLDAGTHEIPLNGKAKFNYVYNGISHSLDFPLPEANLSIATLTVSYVDESNNPVNVIDPITPEWVDVSKSGSFAAAFPKMGDEIIDADGNTYAVIGVYGVPEDPLGAEAYSVKIALAKKVEQDVIHVAYLTPQGAPIGDPVDLKPNESLTPISIDDSGRMIVGWRFNNRYGDQYTGEFSFDAFAAQIDNWTDDGEAWVSLYAIYDEAESPDQPAEEPYHVIHVSFYDADSVTYLGGGDVISSSPDQEVGSIPTPTVPEGKTFVGWKAMLGNSPMYDGEFTFVALEFLRTRLDGPITWYNDEEAWVSFAAVYEDEVPVEPIQEYMVHFYIANEDGGSYVVDGAALKSLNIAASYDLERNTYTVAFPNLEVFDSYDLTGWQVDGLYSSIWSAASYEAIGIEGLTNDGHLAITPVLVPSDIETPAEPVEKTYNVYFVIPNGQGGSFSPCNAGDSARYTTTAEAAKVPHGGVTYRVEFPKVTVNEGYQLTGWNIIGAREETWRPDTWMIEDVQNYANGYNLVVEAVIEKVADDGPAGTGDPEAEFFIITATAGVGGSISPAGNISVSSGKDLLVFIEPEKGYRVDSVKVDGRYVDDTTTYLFDDVDDHHTIHAAFVKTNSGGGGGGTGGGTVHKPDSASPTAPGVSDPDSTGVSAWLNTDDHSSYLVGYPGNLFGPDNNMTRAEAAQMFYNLLLDKNVAITASFKDVPSDAWYAKAVNTLASLGMIVGVGADKFAPDRAITRAEFTTIAMRFTNGILGGENIFPDVAESDWFYDYVIGSIQYGWISGYPDGTFGPNNTILRSEVTAIVNRMLGRSADKDYVEDYKENLMLFTDLSSSHWAYYDIMEATNAHGYTKVNNVEDWTGLN